MSPSSVPSSAAAAPDNGGSYGVCDTVVLVCLAFACGLIVLTVAVCFRRALAHAQTSSAGGRAAPLVGGGRRRGGLAPSAVAAIPKLEYRRCRDGGGWAQCAICLGVVREGELVRRLPACGHLFHVECIDMWLHSHATCPLCRRDVVGEPAGEKV